MMWLDRRGRASQYHGPIDTRGPDPRPRSEVLPPCPAPPSLSLLAWSLFSSPV